MKKEMVCPKCGENYSVDIQRYGGKRIKCRKCEAAIDVPAADAADDGFEVVSEEATVSPSKAMAERNVLDKDRIVGRHAVVSLAVLQRAEQTRREIRDAIVTQLGDEANRIKDITAIEAEIAVVEAARVADDSKRQRLKECAVRDAPSTGAVIASRLMTPLAEGTKGAAQLFDMSFNGAYREAVEILGGPVRPLPEGTDVGSQLTDLGLAAYGKGWLWGKEASKEKDKKYDEARHVKQDTIRAASIRIEEQEQGRVKAIADLRAQMKQAAAAISRDAEAEIKHIEGLLQDGNYAGAGRQAASTAKTCPMSQVGRVLMLLSRSLYGDGNMTEAARQMQNAICMGESAPGKVDAGFNDLWAKASAGLPRI